MFRSLSLKSRLLTLVSVSLLGLIILATFQITHLHTQLLEDRKLTLQSAVDIAFSTVKGFQARETSGEMTREEAQKRARDALRNMRYQGNEYFYVYDSKGLGVMHPIRPEYEGKNHWDRKDKSGSYSVREMIGAGVSGRGFASTFTVKPGGTEQFPKLHYLKHFEAWDWVIGTGLYVDDLDAAFRAQLVWALGLIVVLLAAVAGTAFAVVRAVIADIGGEPSHAVKVMKAVAAGDLSQTTGDTRSDSLLGNLDQLVQSLRQMLAEIAAGADRVTQAAHEINTTSNSVASAAAQQTDSTQAMAAAMEELTVSVNHVSDNAAETERNASAAAELALAGQKDVTVAARQIGEMAVTVGGAASKVRSLSDNAQEVTRIAQAIKEIAGQTNLLALNAAIEAARAGEHGRGFAVVADEVRKLAARTEKATIEISGVVERIQTETLSAAEVMDAALPQADEARHTAVAAAEQLEKIAAASRSAQNLIRDVAASTREQSEASSTLARQVDLIAHQVEETGEGMGVAADAAFKLEETASALHSAVQRFKV
ncbi:methyl-accepting chemotaxis protein [Niveibacterium terrae]|uniref:methyl-accepting chemotaxis protein n=1 Tax=Niveibacterium terrae TaxID=3373598 RepID=UPI003A8EABEE